MILYRKPNPTTIYDKNQYVRGVLTQEDEYDLLQENGPRLLLEQAVPDLAITQTTLATSLDIQNDMVPVVDVSDTTNSPNGRTKHVSVGNLAEAIGIVNIKNYGAVGDGVDDSTAFTNFNSAIEDGALGIIPEGDYRTSVPLKILGSGTHVIGFGKVIIRPLDSGSNLSLQIGDGDTLGDLSSVSNALTANMAAGASSLSIADTTGYAVNDVVCVFSGTSINSSGANRIPTYKQFFTIRSLTATALNFTSQSEYAFNTADDAGVFKPSTNIVSGATIENIHFSNDSTFAGDYLHFITLAYGVTLKNCRLDGYSACGVSIFSDRLLYDNCAFVGYSGLSSARGTKRIAYRDCTYNPRHTSPEDNSGFFEETPEVVYLENCDLKGKLTFTSSGDSTPPKRFIMRGGKITASGLALFASGYNAGGYAFDLEGVEFDAPGGTNSAARTSVVDLASFDSARFANCNFVNAGGAAYAIDGSSYDTATMRVRLEGNNYGASLGVHSGIVFNGDGWGSCTLALTFATPGDLSVAYTTQLGRWVRKNNEVAVSFRIVTSTFTHASASGACRLTGIPFTASADGLNYSGVVGWGGVTFAAAGYTTVTAAAANNQTYIEFFQQGTGVSQGTLNAADMPTGGTVVLEGVVTYRAVDGGF